MNRTQRITSDWLLQSGLTGDELLLEALLRRGFLAFRDEAGVWLGTGSHPLDLDVLRGVRGLKIERVFGHKDRMARVNINDAKKSTMDIAICIVALFDGYSSFTTCGIPDFRGSTEWNSYRKMAWGAKLPIGPATNRGVDCQTVRSGALDLGVALLVKVFPLARIATSFSCDGHGEKEADIWLSFDWDGLWGKIVFETIGNDAPNSIWNWSDRAVTIAPRGEFGDAEIFGMLTDIQHFARCLLHQPTIDKIGRARTRTLAVFGESRPSTERFAKEVRIQINEEFT